MARGSLLGHLLDECEASLDKDMQLQRLYRDDTAYTSKITVRLPLTHQQFLKAGKTGEELGDVWPFTVCGYPFSVRFVRVSASDSKDQDDPDPTHDVIGVSFSRNPRRTGTHPWTCDVSASCVLVNPSVVDPPLAAPIEIMPNEELHVYRRAHAYDASLYSPSNITWRSLVDNKLLWANDKLIAKISFFFRSQDIYPRIAG